MASSAIENMLMMFLKAAGFNPQEFAKGISNFITTSQNKLATLEGELTTLKTEAVVTNAKLDEVLTLLKGSQNVTVEISGIKTGPVDVAGGYIDQTGGGYVNGRDGPVAGTVASSG